MVFCLSIHFVFFFFFFFFFFSPISICAYFWGRSVHGVLRSLHCIVFPKMHFVFCMPTVWLIIEVKEFQHFTFTFMVYVFHYCSCVILCGCNCSRNKIIKMEMNKNRTTERKGIRTKHNTSYAHAHTDLYEIRIEWIIQPKIEVRLEIYVFRFVSTTVFLCTIACICFPPNNFWLIGIFFAIRLRNYGWKSRRITNKIYKFKHYLFLLVMNGIASNIIMGPHYYRMCVCKLFVRQAFYFSNQFHGIRLNIAWLRTIICY